MTKKAVALRWIVGVAVLLYAHVASAYCRTTTCDPTAATCKLDQDGCPRTGPPLAWRSLPIPYRFQADGSQKLDMARAREVIRAAFETWQNVTCDGGRTSLRFEEESDIAADKPLGATRAKTPFGIYFRDDQWTHDDDEESLALTNQLFGEVDGYIDYSDIEINTSGDATFALSDDEQGIDLQAVVTHEVGHYIGLAHSRVPESIMIARYCQSDNRCSGGTDTLRALAPDDVAAVCAMYPPKGIAGVEDAASSSSSCAVSPEGATAETSGRTTALAGGASLAILAILAIRRRRARRSNA